MNKQCKIIYSILLPKSIEIFLDEYGVKYSYNGDGFMNKETGEFYFNEDVTINVL